MMKWVVFGLFCTLLWGCGEQKEEGIPVVELSKAKGEIDLKLSDLLENIRVIPLETRPDALLPDCPSVWVGEKYIITYEGEAIYLFTVDGKYVRKLVQQGRGPDEYLYAMGFTVDKQERYGFLADSNGCICVIDLEKGGIVRKISTAKNVPCELWYSGKDSTLVYALNMMMKDVPDCDICRIALDGTLLHTVKGPSKSGVLQYFWGLNDTIRYKMLFCDTLFQLVDTVTIPYCQLVTERPYSVATECGRVIRILFENKDWLILGCEEVGYQGEGEAIYGRSNLIKYYVLEKSDFSLRKLKSFYMDIFDYTETDFSISQVIGKRASWNINVLQFKELLKDKLDGPLVPEYVKELYHRLDEEDNPVLLVGDIKE